MSFLQDFAYFQMLKVKIIKVLIAQPEVQRVCWKRCWVGREYHHQMTTMKKRIREQVNKVEMLGCPSEEGPGGSMEGHMVVEVT